jgi:hypothetical protein
MLIKPKLTFIISAVIAMSCTSGPVASTQVAQPQHQKVLLHLADTITTRQKAIIPRIEGFYKAAVIEGDESEPCKLTIEIKKKNDRYFYTLTLPGKVKKGAITISKSDDLKQFTCMLTLEGIKWASYEGDISNEDEEHPAKEPEVSVGITMGFINNELTFQNDGNAMNAYTVLQECDQKFVRLVKQ